MILCQTPTGTRLATPEEAATYTGNWRFAGTYLLRALVLSDPDDRRLLCRLAALKLGATAEEAENATLSRSAMIGGRWVFRTKTLRDGPAHMLRLDDCEDIERAAKALAARVFPEAP